MTTQRTPDAGKTITRAAAEVGRAMGKAVHTASNAAQEPTP